MLIEGHDGHYKANVNSKSRLLIDGTTRLEFSDRSESEGTAFQLYTGVLPVTNTSGCMLWFRNDNTEKHFHINSYLISWNGGNVGFDEPLVVSQYVGDSVPSANSSAGYMANVNFTSGVTSLSTQYQWDGVGTGMTIGTAGNFAGSIVLKPGVFQYALDGAYIIGTNNVLSLHAGIDAAGGETVGKLSIVINGWYSPTS